jgi:8-oxo-dGTP pyrophosphatase MutT (NUDIX family)
VVNADQCQVLLRKPTGGHGGFAWTFAKGMANPGETPEQTACREAKEEYGLEVRLLAPLQQWFAGQEWANWFWLAEAATETPGGFDWETEAVQWFGWDDAILAIRKTVVPHRRDRDLEILESARRICLKENKA